MKQIFFGGSRRIGRLNYSIRAQLDSVVDEDAFALVGDANGADRAIQRYLADRGHEHVMVYCSGENCRNNVGRWPQTNVASGRSRADFEFYRAKDKRMCEGADMAVMLWDGESRGTLFNIVELSACGRPVLVYYGPEQAFVKIAGPAELERFLRRCGSKARETAAQVMSQMPSGRERQLALGLE